jgi:inosine-uridine nucleoside N-ribohydrolase
MTELGKRIIIDTDPGIDDALAIALAVASGMEIEGITTIFGNVNKNLFLSLCLFVLSDKY